MSQVRSFVLPAIMAAAIFMLVAPRFSSAVALQHAKVEAGDGSVVLQFATGEVSNGTVETDVNPAQPGDDSAEPGDDPMKTPQDDADTRAVQHGGNRNKPQLTFSPSEIKSCVTTAVILECSARGNHSLLARVTAPTGDDDGVDDSTNGDDDDSGTANVTKISWIKILKKQEEGTGDAEKWGVFAEMKKSGSSIAHKAPHTPGIRMIGSVGGPARVSFVRLTWDQASSETFGTYICQVGMAREDEQTVEILTSEVVTQRDEDEGMQRDQGVKGEDTAWKGEVEARLDKIQHQLHIVEKLVRSGAFKLRKIFEGVGTLLASTTIDKTDRTTSTSPLTPSKVVTTPRPTLNVTRTYVIVGNPEVGEGVPLKSDDAGKKGKRTRKEKKKKKKTKKKSKKRKIKKG